MTDAYQIAFRVPNMLRDLLAEGAFSSAFVPILTERLGKNEQEARRLVWAAFLCLLVMTLILSRREFQLICRAFGWFGDR